MFGAAPAPCAQRLLPGRVTRLTRRSLRCHFIRRPLATGRLASLLRQPPPLLLRHSARYFACQSVTSDHALTPLPPPYPFAAVFPLPRAAAAFAGALPAGFDAAALAAASSLAAIRRSRRRQAAAFLPALQDS